MKKYTLFLFAFVFAFGLSNINFASAANCAPGELFNTSTGQACAVAMVTHECAPGDLFSSVTGKSCSGSISGGGSSGGTGAIPSGGASFSRELQIGARGEDVKVLQQILKNEGYYLGSLDGNYGKRTARAVKDFQSDNDLNVTGNVDADTLKVVNAIPTHVPTPLPFPVPCPLTDMSGDFRHCPPVPTPTPSSPVISGVSGPQSLNVNETGTWTVKASDPTNGSLSYAVVWGDEVIYTYGTTGPSRNSVAQQSATFTHSYSTSGGYTPVFTVINLSGQSARTSLSVNVGGVINKNSLSINPASATIKIRGAATFQALFQNPPSACAQSNPPCLIPIMAPYPVQATWISSNPKVAAVTYKDNCPPGAVCFAQQLDYLTAVVTGVSQGTAIVIATYTNSTGTVLTVNANVTVQ